MNGPSKEKPRVVAGKLCGGQRKSVAVRDPDGWRATLCMR
jgi:hypothetical protein